MKINSIFKFIILVLITCFFYACSKKAIQQETLDLTKYDKWQEERISNLKQPQGYLSLVGLYWLIPGENTFGSSREKKLKFPKEMPEVMGSFLNENDGVKVDFEKGVVVSVDGLIASTANLKSDAEGKPSMMNWKSYFWYIIKRGDKLGVRVKDTLSEARLNFSSIPRFDVSSKWIYEAAFIPAGFQSTIPITNVIGVTTQTRLAGLLRFKHNGNTYSLKALDGGAESFFVIFGDRTNGSETYGGGRFLYVDKPNPEGKTLLDFNLAENPICAFNDFATCPLPPEGNVLNFEIKAGEMIIRK